MNVPILEAMTEDEAKLWLDENLRRASCLCCEQIFITESLASHQQVFCDRCATTLNVFRGPQQLYEDAFMLGVEWVRNERE